jgi:DNA-binding SARP family transcriptional activator
VLGVRFAVCWPGSPRRVCGDGGVSVAEIAAGTSVRFRLLGPLEVTDRSGQPVDVGGTKQAKVLAVLLLEANRVVPADRLVELVWGDEPPPSAAATLQAYVSNLRRALEPDRRPRTPSSVIATRASGYVVLAERSEVDATRFEDVVAEARRLAGADPDGARHHLEAALALWRGPALVDFAGAPGGAGGGARGRAMGGAPPAGAGAVFSNG